MPLQPLIILSSKQGVEGTCYTTTMVNRPVFGTIIPKPVFPGECLFPLSYFVGQFSTSSMESEP
jgi:hypothetical protein